MATEHVTAEERFWPAYVRVTIRPLLVASLAGGAITFYGLALAMWGGMMAPFGGGAGPGPVSLVMVAGPGAIVGLVVGGMQWRGLHRIHRPTYLPRWGWISIRVLVYAVGWVAVAFAQLIAFLLLLSAPLPVYVHWGVAIGVAVGAAVVVAAMLGLLLRLMLRWSKPEPAQVRANPLTSNTRTGRRAVTAPFGGRGIAESRSPSRFREH